MRSNKNQDLIQYTNQYILWLNTESWIESWMQNWILISIEYLSIFIIWSRLNTISAAANRGPFSSNAVIEYIVRQRSSPRLTMRTRHSRHSWLSQLNLLYLTGRVKIIWLTWYWFNMILVIGQLFEYFYARKVAISYFFRKISINQRLSILNLTWNLFCRCVIRRSENPEIHNKKYKITL